MIRRQRGGDSSTNLQGEVVVYNTGITVAAAVEIGLKVADENLAKVVGIANQLVNERIEDFTDAFVKAASEQGEAVLDAVQDPDVQYSLLTAQREYARSGSEDLGETLISLLVKRCSETTGSLRAIVLNEAITTAGRLVPSQLNALTCNWVLTQTSNGSLVNQQAFAAWLNENVVPVAQSLPNHRSVYEHLIFSGCAQISLGQADLGVVWQTSYPGLFARGLDVDEIPEEMRQINGLFVPCLTDPSKVQINALQPEVAEQVAQSVGRPDLAPTLSQLLKSNVKAAGEIVDEVVKLVPAMSGLIETWNSTPLKSLQLTTVGTALAHANWVRVAAGSTGLEVWIPDENEIPKE